MLSSHKFSLTVKENMSSVLYCRYCGRIAHRCLCAKENSKLRQFLARDPAKVFTPLWMENPYKRGVPPQTKQVERLKLRKQYKAFYLALVENFGGICANCGLSEKLVIDHILSIAKGGLSEIENLQLLCADCNRLKGKLWHDCRSDEKST
jgi:5-methylcytosine-specific restriction endonuclease McrA